MDYNQWFYHEGIKTVNKDCAPDESNICYRLNASNEEDIGIDRKEENVMEDFDLELVDRYDIIKIKRVSF